MEVKESEWVTKAIENADRYRNRGGPDQGDEPQLLGGTQLLNTIGMAMNLPMQEPGDWTQDELRRALNNDLVYFKGDARKAIDVIANQISYCCNDDRENFVTVLPIQLYYEGKLYELPVFRVQRYRKSQMYYVDNIGRSYDAFNDWFNNSKLPPCVMAYPHNLKLQLRPGYSYTHLRIAKTPAARPSGVVGQTLDTTAAVVGISSSVGLLFATGGLATPLVLAGIGSAVWGTGRAGYQLIDKGTHGESVNPFTNRESRMLWLGIAANVVSFGAMGASMRLSSLAARGRTISNSFQTFVNFANGANLAVSGIAIVDTTVYLYDHYNDLSGMDVLMHVASIAFWTKGAYTYKTATTIIKEAQNTAFKNISSQLSQEQASELATLRKQFNSDQVLLREYHRAAQAGIPQSVFSQILIDGHAQGTLQFDSAGNLVIPGGHSFSIEFLSSLPQKVRAQYFEILTNLTPEEAETFKDFRRALNDDRVLINGIHTYGVRNRMNARDATEHIINFWRMYTQMNLPGGSTSVNIADGNLVLGRAPPIRISQLSQISSPMGRFFGEHLSRMDVTTSNKWTPSSVNILLTLEGHGMLQTCPVTRIIPNGCAVILLNDQLQVSIYKLNAISADDCKKIFSLIGRLPSTVSCSNLPPDVVRLCIQKYRLRLECQRRESVQWMRKSVENCRSLCQLVDARLQSHEKDRLYTFKSTVDTFKAAPYMNEMMAVVAEMNPKNISEMVAYGEYVVQYVETEKMMLQQKLRNGTIELPRNTKKADWLRKKASDTVFGDRTSLKHKFNELLTIVTNNDMVGVEEVSSNLSDENLIAAVRQKRIKFGSQISAAYHIYKHPTDPYEVYITRANETIRGSLNRYTVTLTQDGDARTMRFENENGSCIILERDGRVLLCTYSPKTP